MAEGPDIAGDLDEVSALAPPRDLLLTSFHSGRLGAQQELFASN
jgi:hypothetical protein